MKRIARWLLWAWLVAAAVACTGGAAPTEPAATVAPSDEAATPTMAATPTAAATATVPAPTATVPAAAATETPAAAPSATAGAVDPGEPEAFENEEAILILAPGNGSRVLSPVRVAGEADSTFEQSLAVRIVTIEGETLVTQPAMIAAELGQRGPFEVEVPFTVTEETQAWIQVFAASARDGGITHLASVGLLLAPDGEPDIVEATPHEERIAITSPEMAETISGGVLQVSGRALASFEQTLIVELLDEEGRLITSTPIMVQATDLGQWGPFEATLNYETSNSTPARVQVIDPSPAFGGEVHVASVEIQLNP